MKDSERPAVVVLDPANDITSEELDVEVVKKRAEDERRMIEEGKITFKKPEKRPLAKPQATKNGDSGDGGKTSDAKDESKPAKIPPPAPPQQSNTQLLSFGDDEEEG